MKKSVSTFAVALTFVLMASACSKGMSLAEYFSQVGRIQQEFEKKGQAIQEEAANNTAVDEAGTLAVIRAVLSKSVELARQTKEQLDALKPPSEANDAHEALVDAVDGLLTAMQAVQTEVDKATTVNEALDVVGGDELTFAGDALDRACRTLSAIAKDNDVTTTLDCGEDEAAQSSLRNSIAAAKTIFTDTDDYSNITVNDMSGVEPSLTYVQSPLDSTGPNEISIYTDGSLVYAAAALSDSGNCLYIRDDATSGTTYGTGPADACSGDDANAGATSAAW